MEINIENKSFLLIKTKVLVLFSWEEKPVSAEIIELDKKLNGFLKSVIKEENFKAKENETLFINIGRSLGFHEVVVVGLGKRTVLSFIAIQKAAGSAIRILQKKKIDQASLSLPVLPFKNFPPQKITEAVTKGVILANYQFTEYKTDQEEIPLSIKEISILSKAKTKLLAKGIKEGKIIAEAINYSRDYGNQPSNKSTPSYLAKMAQAIAKIPKVHCQILEKEAMQKLKMGAILGVAQGTLHPPKFIILEYKGKPAKKDFLVFVGKGITFDSGGISIKPSERMEEMKYDMAGGAAVLEAVEAIAKLKLPLNIVGLIPATENLPSGESFKPGDILTSASGKTIEVITTDAEGRLILADALFYAKRYKPKAVIDLATLTGACIVALGRHASGLFGNNEKLISKVEQASRLVGEKVWKFPLWPEYFEDIKSEIADLKNVGSSNGGGPISAAAFLASFIKGYPWAHVDITAAWNKEEKPYLAKGANGFGVALLVELARNWK